MAEPGRRTVRLSEASPAIGIPIEERPGITRIVAPNPGPMTYHGTNTWLIDLAEPGGPVALLDPGPDDDAHLAALLDAGAGRITHILVSHGHGDHVALAPRLADALRLPIHAHAAIARTGLTPGAVVEDGHVIGPLTAIHTPGHATEHLCFAHPDGLFTADHVMGWSTSVVPPPPTGDAADYLASLRLLLDRADPRFFSGHGPVIEHPGTMLTHMIANRLRRERQVLALIEAGVADLDTLTARLYPSLREGLLFAARANIAGHVAKLEADGAIAPGAVAWQRQVPIPATF